MCDLILTWITTKPLCDLNDINAIWEHVFLCNTYSHQPINILLPAKRKQESSVILLYLKLLCDTCTHKTCNTGGWVHSKCGTGTSHLLLKWSAHAQKQHQIISVALKCLMLPIVCKTFLLPECVFVLCSLLGMFATCLSYSHIGMRSVKVWVRSDEYVSYILILHI